MADNDTPPDRSKAASDPIDTRLVRRLADILNDTDLTEIEVERGELRVRVARQAPASVQAAPAVMTAVAAPMLAPVAAPTLAAAPGAAAGPSPGAEPERRGDVVDSPMVGTIYLQAQPGTKPFIQVGDRVSEGQTLLIIEAMKTMNPIPARKAGVVLEVLVEDGQPVEYGEPLVVIE